MIQPLAPYTIKGVIWYQGESNVGRAEQYKKLFPLMIEDWRTQWGKELPFYYVQIAPFLYSAADQKEQSQKLRDAQRYALKLPKTGMVTTLDIGYLKTAHPPYKQEVGKRLATFALKNEYGEKMLVASGPLYKKTIMKGKELIVEFESIGSGLLASNQGLSNFEIAGANKAYVKAEAKIVNNKVVVSSQSVAVPVYVRYAWSDGSSASLFNKEGLPAATFTNEGGL
jgi:sialate O-acetylesterase